MTTAPTPSAPHPTALLRTVVMCDLVESTALIEKLGDQRGAEAIRRHDRMARDLAQVHGGREIDKTDGFLLLFAHPAEAAGFALAYQHALHEWKSTEAVPLCARVGVHVGDVLMWDNSPEDVAHGAKPLELEGLVKPEVARLMGLARPGQILCSGIAHDLALRGLRESAGDLDSAEWRFHGQYRLKGRPEPIDVYEIGEAGIAPFAAPPSSAKAERVVPWWRRPRVVLAECSLAVVLVAAGLYLSTRSEPAIAFAARDWIVVGDSSNLTGVELLDASFDTAFRLALEQSRFVNVVPDVQIRQTLGLMRNDPKTTIVDRQLAAEIAVREGARAVVLTTVSPYGKQLRLIAELIDPVSTRSVATVSAEADGLDDILPATDRLVRQLRGRLGESIEQIAESSAPLAKVTTDNLEALRAYSLSLEAARDNDLERSNGLLRRALELDPQFALAYARIGANYLSLGQQALAKAKFEQALKLTERLSVRERAYLEAHATSIRSLADGLERWRIYSDLYPDDAAGGNNVGLFSYIYLNDCEQELPFLARAVASRHPLRAFSSVVIGACLTLANRLDEAAEPIERAYALGLSPRYLDLAVLRIAQRRYVDADAALNSAKAKLGKAPFPEYWLRRATLFADQGMIAAAQDAVQSGLAEVDRASDLGNYWRLRAAQAALLEAAGQTRAAKKLTESSLEELLSMTATQRDRPHFDYRVHLAEWSIRAARYKKTTLAKRALAELARADTSADGNPNETSRLAVTAANAALALATGHPERAEKILTAERSGISSWLLRVTRLRVETALKHSDQTAALRDGLIADRGRALVEWNDSLLGQTERTIQNNCLLIDAAEARLKEAPQAAGELLRKFRGQWQHADADLPIMARADALARALGPAQVAGLPASR